MSATFRWTRREHDHGDARGPTWARRIDVWHNAPGLTADSSDQRLNVRVRLHSGVHGSSRAADRLLAGPVQSPVSVWRNGIRPD